MAIISVRSRRSIVLVMNGYIYKKQPKYLADNEMWCLKRMRKYGCVPRAERIHDEIIKMELVKNEPITDVALFEMDASKFLLRLSKESIRHGDLTSPHVFVRNNRICVIDWAESRDWYDPRPDKRREGDEYWWTKTVNQLLAQLN
jgi:RIO-like serine/threonine protein kinase